MNNVDLITALGKQKHGENFRLPIHWNNETINKIEAHFLMYKIENRVLKLPEKGLFFCSDITDDAPFLIFLLKIHIENLYFEQQNEQYYERVLIDNKLSFKVVSARQLSMECLEMKPLEIIKKYSSIGILTIIDFGKESSVQLPNYNKFDFVPEFVNKRYMDHHFLQSNTVLYIFTNSTPAELKKRYSKEVFYHLKSLTDELILSTPK